MEFTVLFTQNRRHHAAFGRLSAAQSRGLSTALFICPLIMLISGCFLFASDGSIATLLLSLFFFLYWVFFPRFSGWASFRNVRSNGGSLDVAMTFLPDGFRLQSSQGDSVIPYSSIVCVAEDDSIFAFFNTRRTAYLLPKEALSPEQEALLRAQVLPLLPCKPPRRRHSTLPGILLYIVLFLVGCVGAGVYRYTQSAHLSTYGTGPFAVTLSGHVTPFEDEDYDFSAIAGEATVLTFYEEKALLTAMGTGVPRRTSDYLALIIDLYELPHEQIFLLDTGTACCVISDTGDGLAGTFYRLAAVAEGEDAFWYTEFVCPAKYAEKYETLFLNWAQSIVVSGPVEDS